MQIAQLQRDLLVFLYEVVWLKHQTETSSLSLGQQIFGQKGFCVTAQCCWFSVYINEDNK